MKTIKAICTAAFLALYVVWTLASCTTTTIRTVTTDKAGTVTETTTTTTASDPAALILAGAVATAYAPPRAFYVREEKSGDIMRILNGRPITRQEIANRWRATK